MTTLQTGDGSAAPDTPELQSPAGPRVRRRVKLGDYPPAHPEPVAEQDANCRVAPAAEPLVDHASDPLEAKPEPAAHDYPVGYGKPPKHTQFRPGQSGNPKGRPKGAKGLKTMVRETMTQRLPVRTATGVKKMTRIEATIYKTHELAMKGNVRALTQILSLYAAAVPEVATIESAEPAEDLTATDLATLDALRNLLAPPATDMLQVVMAPMSPTMMADSVPDEVTEPQSQNPNVGRGEVEGPPEEIDCDTDWDRTP